MKKPRLSLCMIAKDEEHNLPRCLNSVKDVVDEIILVDTGSSDRTIEVAERFGARVLRRRWRGSFAKARNCSLEAATGDWILVLDADEELEAGKGPLVRALMDMDDIEAVSFPVVNLVSDGVWTHSESAASARMWRNRPVYRYERDLHEQILPSIYRWNRAARVAQVDVRIFHYGYLRQEVKRKGKRDRNLPLAQAAASQINDDFSHFNLGIELMIHNRYEEALTELRTAERLMPADSALLAKLRKSIVSCLIHLNRDQDAAATAEEYLAETPDYTDLYYLRGFAQYRSGDIAGAVRSFGRCLELGPAPVFKYPGAVDGYGSHEAAWMLGQMHEAAQDYDAAVNAYRRAFELNPRWLTPAFRCAVLLRRRLAGDALVDELERLVGQEHPDCRLIVAQCLYVAKDYLQTIAYLDRPELQGEDPEARHFLRGHALLRLGKWPEAADSLRQVTPASPNYREAAVSLAWLYFSLGRAEEGEALLRSLGGDESVYIQLADISLQLAREWFLRSLVLGGDPGRLLPAAQALQTMLGAESGA